MCERKVNTKPPQLSHRKNHGYISAFAQSECILRKIQGIQPDFYTFYTKPTRIFCLFCCRPRVGAWIEIYSTPCKRSRSACRPRVGAWIEIQIFKQRLTERLVAPVWGRGLKYALYETWFSLYGVAPVWGRGLKFFYTSLP